MAGQGEEGKQGGGREQQPQQPQQQQQPQQHHHHQEARGRKHLPLGIRAIDACVGGRDISREAKIRKLR
ncbi:hypothetical protein PTSG_13216, partial [Salpingoeca rosetta]